MNLEGQLAVQDFTTLARVKALVQPTGDDGSQDALIEDMIATVSAQFVRFLGLHALRVERTETYEIRRFYNVVTLDGKPVDSTAAFTLKYGSDLSASSFVTWQAAEYAVHKAAGWVRLFSKTPYSPGYVRVTYTGGLGTDTDNLIASFPELAGACERQVLYLLQRKSTLGGNVQLGAGGATAFQGEYGLLKDVESVLAAHRRAA